MNIKQLEYFVSAAETLNFTKTGEQFFISQTAISLQIKALEEELETQLFERKNHRVSITYAGRMFLEDAKAILNRMQLQKEPIIIFQAYEDAQDETKKIAHDYEDAGFLPNVVYTSNDINTILLLVAVKKGIAVLPEYTLQKGADIRNLVFIPLTGEKEQRNLYLIWRKDNQNKTLQQFLNHMEICD